jgi:hypothetical protein
VIILQNCCDNISIKRVGTHRSAAWRTCKSNVGNEHFMGVVALGQTGALAECATASLPPPLLRILLLAAY